jgi:hypothetical protein
MSKLKSIDLKETEHRPNYRILSIYGEIQELKQVLYWRKIVKTYNKISKTMPLDPFPIPEPLTHGVARTIGWGDINHVEAEIKRGEEMIAFLKELLLHGILWY